MTGSSSALKERFAKLKVDKNVKQVVMMPEDFPDVATYLQAWKKIKEWELKQIKKQQEPYEEAVKQFLPWAEKMSLEDHYLKIDLDKFESIEDLQNGTLAFYNASAAATQLTQYQTAIKHIEEEAKSIENAALKVGLNNVKQIIHSDPLLFAMALSTNEEDEEKAES